MGQAGADEQRTLHSKDTEGRTRLESRSSPTPACPTGRTGPTTLTALVCDPLCDVVGGSVVSLGDAEHGGRREHVLTASCGGPVGS